VGGPPDQITCIDCGGVCSRLTEEPELGWAAGDLVVYRCRDCLDRWDLVVEDDEVADEPPPPGFRT
jgi:hypothetical protein